MKSALNCAARYTPRGARPHNANSAGRGTRQEPRSVPVSTKAQTAKPSGPAGGASVRAEFPPPQYWRRWCEDAPPASFPGDDDGTAQLSEIPMLASQAATSSDGEPPYRILIVEDDRSQALFAESVLNGTGMQAKVVSVGSEMMQAMEAFHPDLVLMDLHMPGMSGTELTGLIRSARRLRCTRRSCS